MLSTKITENKIVDESILIAINLGVICTLGPLKIDFASGLPTTLQSLLVVWFALAFGLRVGLTSVLAYLFLGGLGFGVFSGGASGWQHFIGSNGGFLLAFPVGAFIAGSLAQIASTSALFKKAKFISSAFILFISQTVILALGLIWQSMLVGETIPLVIIMDIFLPGLLIKTAIGTLALVIITRALSRIKS